MKLKSIKEKDILEKLKANLAIRVKDNEKLKALF